MFTAHVGLVPSVTELELLEVLDGVELLAMSVSSSSSSLLTLNNTLFAVPIHDDRESGAWIRLDTGVLSTEKPWLQQAAAAAAAGAACSTQASKKRERMRIKESVNLRGGLMLSLIMNMVTP